MPQASPVWQTAFLVWSLVCIGWMIFCGWRAGVVRGAVSLAGLVFGYLCGAAAAVAIPPGLLEWMPVPGLLAQLFAGVLVGFTVFFVVWFIGAALFKRTAQHGSGLLRVVWGLGGAVFGLIFGLLVVLASLAGIRALGSFSEARLETYADTENARTPQFWEPSLVKLKRSIEAGETGTFIRSVDITPDGLVRIVTKLGRVASDPRAAARLLESPHLEPIVRDRVFLSLTEDPEINNAAVQGDYAAILTNPKVLEAARNPELWEKLQAVPWEAVLDEALLRAQEPNVRSEM